MDSKADLVTITLTGPSSVWFGVGFNASAMKDAPWAIIVEGDGNVTERKLRGVFSSGDWVAVLRCVCVCVYVSERERARV